MKKIPYKYWIIIVVFFGSFAFSKNFRSYIVSHHIDLLKIITPMLIAYLVYKYTTDNHKRTLLNELDSKSEWRKTLFTIAGKKKIKIKDVYQLRASLRFTHKNESEYLNNDYFDNMNILIIKYCEKIINKDLILKDDLILNNNSQETIRLFCRYMLADHWEKNQNKDFKFNNPEKEIELCNYTLNKFLLINSISFNDKNTKNNFFNLFNDVKIYIKTMTP